MVADAAKLPFPDNSYDTIVDTFGLCSFDDPVAVLKELQRVCKPDGKILLLEHGRTKAYTGLSSYLDKHAERHAKNWGELIVLLEISLSAFLLFRNNLLVFFSLDNHISCSGCVWNRDIDNIVERSGLKMQKLHNFHFGTTYYIVAKPSNR
jgi:methyltransferase OMS1